MSKILDADALSRTVTGTAVAVEAPIHPTAEALPAADAAHYELLGEVARGGIGRIIKAYDSRLEREVALKLLHDDRAGHARFVREAMLTARLQHPSIIPVHEIGRFASGALFFAMKLANGCTSRPRIRRASSARRS